MKSEEGNKLREEIANQSFASNESEQSQTPDSDNAMPDENYSTPKKFTPEKSHIEKAGPSRLVAYDSSPESMIIQNSTQTPKLFKNTVISRKRIITIDSSPEGSIVIINSPVISQIFQDNGATKSEKKIISRESKTLPIDLKSDTDSESKNTIKRKFVKQRPGHFRRRNDFLQSDSERSMDSEDSDMTDLIDDKPVKSELPLDLAKKHFLEQDEKQTNFLLKRLVFYI